MRLTVCLPFCTTSQISCSTLPKEECRAPNYCISEHFSVLLIPSGTRCGSQQFVSTSSFLRSRFEIMVHMIVKIIRTPNLIFFSQTPKIERCVRMLNIILYADQIKYLSHLSYSQIPLLCPITQLSTSRRLSHLAFASRRSVKEGQS